MSSIWSPGTANYDPQSAGGGGISLGVPTATLVGTNVAPTGGINVSGVNPMSYTDPTVSAPASGSTSDSNGYGSASATTTSAPATPPPLSQAIINAILGSIQDTVNKNQAAHDAAATQNSGADANAEGSFNGQVQSNTASRATAIQNADQAAASGERGLRAVLASLGALNGTGQLLAGRAVADSANNDVGTADNTFTTNNQSIVQAHKDLLNQEAARNSALETALNTDNNGARASGIQNILTAAHDQGDTATYNKFLPQLVAADAVPNQAIESKPIVYATAPTSSYAPNSSQTVTAAPSRGGAPSSTTPVNSALYTKKTS